MEKYLDFRKNIDDAKLKEVAETIKAGGIVIFPTETVYGIGTNGLNEQAVEKLYDVKQRRKDKAINLLVSDIEGVPIAAPSANISGMPSGTSIEGIKEQFENKVDYIIDTGKSKLGVASTIVQVIDNIPHILRKGTITADQIKEVAGDIVLDYEKVELKEEIRTKLFELSDEKYKQFHGSLCPGSDDIIGVRVPVIRQYAKELYQEKNWQQILEIKPNYAEEAMLQGMIIGFIKNKEKDIKEILKYIENFIPSINNWAICDVFCAGLKITKKYPKEMWEFINKYIKSKEEFEIRFGIVMLLDYYITEEYIDKIFDITENTKHEGYYVKMAVAWLLSICYIKYPHKTLEYLKNTNIDDFTYNKALQKIIESYRVTEEDKEIIRKMKRG